VKEELETTVLKLDGKGILFPEYELAKEDGEPIILGVGGSSCVYEMRRRKDGTPGAMKVIGPEASLAIADRFKANSRLQRRLSEICPYIINIQKEMEIVLPANEEVAQNGKAGRRFQFQLMEKAERILEMDGERRMRLNDKAPKDQDGLMEFVRQVGDAIAAAHENGIVHCDIKLENIFWSEAEKRYKLGDYGIAMHIIKGEETQTVYSEGYAAPERVTLKPFGKAADIYSFGVVMYLLLNDLKFPGSSGYFVTAEQYEEGYVFPAPKNAKPQAVRVIQKMCSFRAEDRYHSIHEAAAALIGALSGEGEENAGRTVFEYGRTVQGAGTRSWSEGSYGETEYLTAYGTELAADDSRRLKRITSEVRKSDRRIGTESHGGLEQLSRYEEIKAKEKVDMALGLRGVLCAAAVAVLTAFFLFSMPEEAGALDNALVWFMPAAVLAEALLIGLFGRRPEVAFMTIGILVVLIAICQGAIIPGVVLAVCAIFMRPVLAAAGALGTAAWMAACRFGGGFGLEILAEKDVAWILLTLIYLCVLWQIMHENYVREGKCGADVLGILIPVGLVVAGIVIIVLKTFFGLNPPEIIVKLHFVRMGLLVYVGGCVLAALYDMRTKDKADEAQSSKA